MRNEQILRDLMRQFIDQGIPGCSLSISHHGEVVFEHSEGYADVEAKKEFRADTLFRAFSCTKPITVAAAMILLERGKILLTDPIERYLPCFANMRYYAYNGAASTQILPCRNSITIRDLMRMTSGIPYGGRNNLSEQDIACFGSSCPETPSVSTQEFVRQIATVPLAFEPGTHWMYGFGIDVLGAIIEVVSGKRFGEFLQNEIFAPLGMKDTGFKLREEDRPRLAAMYEKGEDGTLTRIDGRDFAYAPEYSFESGGGGLLSTIHDMTRFSQMMAMGGELDGNRILSSRTIDLIRMDHLSGQQRLDYDEVSKRIWPNMLGYSFGLGCRTLVDPATGGSNSSIGEFAWSGAAGSYALIDPELQISAEYTHQLWPSDRNMQGYCHPRLRNAIYAALC